MLGHQPRQCGYLLGLEKSVFGKDNLCALGKFFRKSGEYLFAERCQEIILRKRLAGFRRQRGIGEHTGQQPFLQQRAGGVGKPVAVDPVAVAEGFVHRPPALLGLLLFLRFFSLARCVHRQRGGGYAGFFRHSRSLLEYMPAASVVSSSTARSFSSGRESE